MDLHTIYEYFKDAILNNQFAQGGFAIGILSGLFFYGRQSLTAFKTWILRKTTMRIEILGDESAYSWCQLWLSQSRFGKKTQTLMVCDDGKGSCNLVPGEGRHIFFYKKRLFFLWNVVEPVRNGELLVGYKKSVTLQIIPGNRKIGEEFIRETESFYNAKHKSAINVYTPVSWSGSWSLTSVVHKRPIDSVVLAPDIKQLVLDDIKDFKNSRERYKTLNIPWRRGYLLHGKPGNGKTSLALAIASEFDYALYVLQLSGIHDDDRLRTICEMIPENAVLLIEDVDCCTQLGKRTAADKEKVSRGNSGITLSGMLNALDGVTSGDGRIVVMTSNHPDQLDPALIRAGRADCHVEISTPTHYQVANMFERFYNNKDLGEQFAQGLDYDKMNMAQLQVYFLKHKTPQIAMEHRWDLIIEKEEVKIC